MNVTWRSRRQRGIAALSAVLCLLLIGAAAATEQSGADRDLAYNVPCAGPTTPFCASRNLADCIRYRDPRRCEAVGVKGVRFSPEEKAVTPSTEPYPKVTGVRRVTPARFQVEKAPAGYRVPPGLIGTHEVRMMLDICDPATKCFAQASEFYRKDGDRWVIVSWTDNALSCEGWHDEPEPQPECRTYIPFLKPWYD